MTNVDFYVVSDAGADARLRVAARLADKALAAGHKVFINSQSEDQAKSLDELLWSFRPSSFLPHALATETTDELITIGWGQEPDGHGDILINLELAPPGFFSRFERVLEVVTQDESALAALRKAWVFYKDRGYPLKKHDL